MAIKLPPVVDPIVRALGTIYDSLEQVAAQKGGSEAGKIFTEYSKGGRRLLNEYMGIPTNPEATVSTLSMFAKQNASEVVRSAQKETAKDNILKGPESNNSVSSGPK